MSKEKKATELFGMFGNQKLANNAAYGLISKKSLNGYNGLKAILKNKNVLNSADLSAEEKDFLNGCDGVHIMVGLRNYAGT